MLDVADVDCSQNRKRIKKKCVESSFRINTDDGDLQDALEHTLAAAPASVSIGAGNCVSQTWAREGSVESLVDLLAPPPPASTLSLTLSSF